MVWELGIQIDQWERMTLTKTFSRTCVQYGLAGRARSDGHSHCTLSRQDWTTVKSYMYIRERVCVMMSSVG